MACRSQFMYWTYLFTWNMVWCQVPTNSPSPFGNDNTFICDSNQECMNQNIVCIDNQNCFVYCRDIKACKSANIYGPNTGNLTVICNEKNACWNAKIYCPAFGYCDITCITLGPINSGEVVYAYCYNIIINATSIQSGALTIQSTGRADHEAIEAGHIYCPGNSLNCILQIGKYGLVNSDIYTENDSQLTITASGSNALRSTNIRCPTNNSTICSINVSGNGTNMLTDTEIFSVNGLGNVSITCNFVTDKSDCYDPSIPPKLRCQYDFNGICNIELISGFNEWKCTGTDGIDVCSDATANGYYGNTLICNERRECLNNNLYCHPYENCQVYCIQGYQSCYSATITGPLNGNLSLLCSSTEACKNAEIVYPSTSNSTGNLQVECNQKNACMGLDVNCPTFGNSDITCHSISPAGPPNWQTSYCESLLVDARNTISGDLLIQSTGISLHEGMDNAQIYCPGNNNNCIIQSGQYGILDTNIYTETDTTSLQITASGINTLRASRIYCNSLCLINTSGAGPNMLTDTEIFAVNGFKNVSLTCNYNTNATQCYDDTNSPKLYCQSDFQGVCNIELVSGFNNNWQCSETDIIQLCKDSSPNGYFGNKFICNEYRECYQYSLRCNQNDDCEVHCTGKESCSYATINAPINGNLTVTCFDAYACEKLTINGPSNGTLYLECNEKNSCMDLDIYCPMFGNCYINCITLGSMSSGFRSGHSYCERILIDATSTILGDLFIQSTGISIHEGIDNGNIYCPGNNNKCIIKSEEYGILDTNIFTQVDTSQLAITASGIYSLQRSIIYCPLGNNSCTINAIGNGPDMLTGTSIYALHGFINNNLQLICNYSTSIINNCYNILLPKIFCRPGWTHSCDLILQSGYDTWECNGATPIFNLCDWTFSPTAAPSFSPTLNPTISPTIAPSLSPTTPPTLSPTITPTISPSLAPTSPPTIVPSIAPSLTPTISPTLSPSLTPTSPPTIAPSITPSLAPSLAPSLTPSLAPSLSPSLSPSISPSTFP
eukprot:395905_1